MAEKVAGDLYESITGQLFEIGRQLRQLNGYPYDALRLQSFLQRAVEGHFPNVLEHITTVPVTVSDTFVAADHLKVDTGEDAPVQVEFIRPAVMLAFGELVEGARGRAELKIHKLRETASRRSVIQEFGGLLKGKVLLQHFFSLIASQGRGQAGPLLTNGLPNYACIRHPRMGSYEIAATWDNDSGGWLIQDAADQWWSEGSQVVSL